MTDEQPPIDEAATQLRATLSVLYRAIRQSKVTGDLTLPESSALGRLNRHGPMTAAQLAREEQITPQSIGTTLRGLIERGLVERRPDPDDGRRLTLTLTDAGRAVILERRSERAELLARALARLDADERDRMLAALPALARLAELADEV